MRPKTVSKAMSEAKIVIPDVVSSNKSLLGQKLMINSFENQKSIQLGSQHHSSIASKQSLENSHKQSDEKVGPVRPNTLSEFPSLAVSVEKKPFEIVSSQHSIINEEKVEEDGDRKSIKEAARLTPVDVSHIIPKQSEEDKESEKKVEKTSSIANIQNVKQEV